MQNSKQKQLYFQDRLSVKNNLALVQYKNSSIARKKLIIIYNCRHNQNLIDLQNDLSTSVFVCVFKRSSRDLSVCNRWTTYFNLAQNKVLITVFIIYNYNQLICIEMKNQFASFLNDSLKDIKCLRKINNNDRFPCFTCFDDPIQKYSCDTCEKRGFIFGSHPMVQFSEDFIQKKLSFLKEQQKAMQIEKNNRQQSYNILDLQQSCVGNKKVSIYDQVSSDEENQKLIHQDIGCDLCGKNPLVGYRYQCETCQDYDLCGNCYRKGQHDHQFKIIKQAQVKHKLSIPSKKQIIQNMRKSIKKK